MIVKGNNSVKRKQKREKKKAEDMDKKAKGERQRVVNKQKLTSRKGSAQGKR